MVILPRADAAIECFHWSLLGSGSSRLTCCAATSTMSAFCFPLPGAVPAYGGNELESNRDAVPINEPLHGPKSSCGGPM